MKIVVVGNHRGNGGEQPSGRRNQRLGDAGCHGAEGGSASRSQSVKRVDNAPDGTEQSDERRDGAGSGEPRQPTLKARQLFGRCDLACALNCDNFPVEWRGGGCLPTVLLKAGLENRNQGRRLELVCNRGDVLKTLRLAERSDESGTLGLSSAEAM